MIYEIKEFSGGISSFSDRGIKGSFKMGKNLSIRKDIDSLSSNQALEDEGLLGFSHSSSASVSQSASLSPSASASASRSDSSSSSKSQSPSASASKSASKSASPSGSASPSSSVSPSPSPSAGLYNVYEDLVRFFVKATDGNTYGFGDTGFIYRRYTDGYTRNVYKDPDGEIKGAVEKPSSNGKTYLQWATGTKLMQKELPGESDWSDVTTVAQNLTGTDWHTMVQVGGANMICNGSWLAMCGYDDSWTNEALNLIPGNISKTLVERNGRVIIGSYKAGYPTKGINAMIDAEVPLSQVGDDGELLFANMNDTMPAKRFPGGGQVNPGGVTNEIEQVNFFEWGVEALSWIDKQTVGNMSLWGVFNGDSGYNGVYSYGRKNKDQPFTLNLEYALDVDEIGAVANVEGTTIISYRDGNDYGVKAVDDTTKATGTYESLEFKAPIKKDADVTIWDRVELYMEALPSGASVELHYKLNKSSSWTQAYVNDGSTSYSTVGGKKASFRLGIEGEIFELKIVLNPVSNSSPIIYRARTYFH